MRSIALLAVVIGAMPMKAQEKRTMTVGQLFELVESNSKTLRQQKTSVEFASKEIDAARSQRLPDINTSFSVSYNGNVLITDRDFSDAHGYSVPHFGNSFALEAQQVVYAGGAVSADAIPGITYKGKVESIAAGTGSAFSPIPVDNATGNFVKVEQRVPVRIVLTDDNDEESVDRLLAGLNVEVEVKY